MTSLNLLVLRVPDMDLEATFYQSLGIEFEKHSHGDGPEHYAAEHGPCVFELYPARNRPILKPLGIVGFTVPSVTTAFVAALEAGGKVGIPPRNTEWGYSAQLLSPSGQTVSITEAKAIVDADDWPAANTPEFLARLQRFQAESRQVDVLVNQPALP